MYGQYIEHFTAVHTTTTTTPTPPTPITLISSSSSGSIIDITSDVTKIDTSTLNYLTTKITPTQIQQIFTKSNNLSQSDSFQINNIDSKNAFTYNNTLSLTNTSFDITFQSINDQCYFIYYNSDYPGNISITYTNKYSGIYNNIELPTNQNTRNIYLITNITTLQNNKLVNIIYLINIDQLLIYILSNQLNTCKSHCK